MRGSQICLVLFAVVLAGITAHRGPYTASIQRNQAALMVNANNKFASTMYGVLSQTPGNVFFSPISLHTVLSMLQQGAEGKTLKVLSSTLKLLNKKCSADGFAKITRELNNVNGVTLEIANKLYIKNGYAYKPSFKDVLERNFHASVENIDFVQRKAAAKTINSWVEKKTHHKIKDLISSDALNNYTRSVIVNAIYFKGDWKEKFDKDDTYKEPFYTSETDQVKVEMMHRLSDYGYKMDNDLDAQIINLPYVNEELSMVIVLPNKRTGITELEDKLASYNLSTIIEDIKNTRVQLTMPKFKIEMKMDLKKPLETIGLTNIFRQGDADFSGLLDNSESLYDLYVSDVLQKAFIEVNEGGSEAAAATGISEYIIASAVIGRPPPIVPVKMDHPFIFVLARNRNLLFYGRIASFD